MGDVIGFPGENVNVVWCDAAVDVVGKLGNDQACSGIIKRGVAVLGRLECNLTWGVEWRDLILALGLGRGIALNAAETNKPQGPKYRKAIGVWLRCYGFDRIDEGDRSRLLKCFDNLAAIDAWRATLSSEEQVKLNHPRTVLAHWQRSQRPHPAAAAAAAAGAASSVSNISVDGVLTWLQTATYEEKRQVADALAQDAETARKLLRAKAMTTPEQLYRKAMRLFLPEEEEGAPAVH